jgi:DNA invertase Pin-like site-specific DNA recombinase
LIALAGPVRPSGRWAIRYGTPGVRKGRLLSTMLAAIAEFERGLIRERTGEGRRQAMANGVKFGRKRKLSEYQRAEAVKRRAAGETLASIASRYQHDLAPGSVRTAIIGYRSIANRRPRAGALGRAKNTSVWSFGGGHRGRLTPESQAAAAPP